MSKGSKVPKTKRISKPSKNRFRYKLIKKQFHEKKLKASQNLSQKPTKGKITPEKKIDTNDAHHEENQIQSEKIQKEYMVKLLNNHYDTYVSDYLKEIFENSTSNRKFITKEILKKYNITEEIRKFTFNYFYNFINYYKIGFKYYFSSVSIFDNFLVYFSEEESNKEKCENFFKSKVTNEISITKLILFIFCCFYVSSKFFSTDSISIDQILQFENAKNEVTFDDLSNLINDIIIYGGNDIDINIYSFIDIYMFKIRKAFNSFEDENNHFLERFEKIIPFLTAKVVKCIYFSKVHDSLKALAIILFSYKFCKYYYRINYQLEIYIDSILISFTSFLTEYFDICDLPIIINFLYNNWSN